VLPCDVVLDGMSTLIVDGRAAATPSLRRAVDLFLGSHVSSDEWIRLGQSASSAAFALWDCDSWVALNGRIVEVARASGALAPLALALNANGLMISWCGDLETADALVAEQDSVKEATGIRMPSYGGQLLAAYRGRIDEASAHALAVDHLLVEQGNGMAVQMAKWATAVLNNGLGRYAAAYAAGREAANQSSFMTPFALSELIESAVRCGSKEQASDALGQLSALTVADSDWAVGIEARSTALLTSGGEAEHSYAESVTRLARTPLRPEIARSRLLYGEWLRRENRRLDARQQLRLAYDAFVAIGAEAFAERARRELVATGEKVRQRDMGTRSVLTRQEEHIARLARDGHTNLEIGAELFLSARTVEWHLRKVFIKLDVTSRRELRDALPPTGR
jgi:DNA-binding CsgD family transcriptional regulator